jgi:hypothetical protein
MHRPGSNTASEVYRFRENALNESRDLALTIDFRHILAEAVTRTLGVTYLELIFPGAHPRTDSFLGLT